MRSYYVYILASLSKVLYTGVTNDLERRVREHKEKTFGGFTARYNVHRLVYVEEYDDVHAAITREKEIKGWKRIKKINLIESQNKKWMDLSLPWYS